MHKQTNILANFRGYQESAVFAALDSLRHPASRSLIEIPTGGGKTWVIAALAELATTHRVFIVTPRCRLLQQTRDNLQRIPHGVLAAGQGSDTGRDHRVIVATMQTLLRRGFEKPDLFIIDECHLLGPESRSQDLLNRYPDAKVIGLTATPVRGSESLSDMGWDSIFKVGILDLVREKYLVLPRSIATVGDATATKANRNEVSQAIIPGLIRSVKREQSRKPLIFTADIKHAEAVTKMLCAAGETNAFVVHSKQSMKDQNANIAAFEKTPDRAWLVNVGLVSLGVDIPCIDAIVFMRDVGSFAFLSQAIGRGLRLFSGKNECLVFDFGSGTKRFGFIDDPILPKSTEGRSGEGPVTKTCPDCRTLCYPSARECGHCGHQFSFQTNIRSSAHEVELLSRKMQTLTISDAQVTRSGVNWQTEYRFVENPVLRSYRFSRNKDLQFGVGARVFVEFQSAARADIRFVAG